MNAPNIIVSEGARVLTVLVSFRYMTEVTCRISR